MGSKKSKAPAPDPRLIEAQIKSMGLQDEAIAEIMAQSREMQPLIKEQTQFGLDSARTAFDQSQQDRTYALGRRDELTGVQDTMLADAKSFNTEGKRAELAAQAGADVASSFAGMRQQSNRDMARRGVNPFSGKMAQMQTQQDLGEATARAGAANAARVNARNEGRALNDRAANVLSGFPAMGMQATGAAAGFGANGVNIANAGAQGMNAGFAQAGGLAGQMGSNAANMYGTMGSYKNQADANALARVKTTMDSINGFANTAKSFM
jgi:hypothetical protein